jgi:AcrR family transcriptional regulator
MPLLATARPASVSPRAVRARDVIADALLELIRAGDLRATAPRIAAQAGVSLRTVFHHFPDLESLHRHVAARQLGRLEAALAPLDAALPLSARIDAFVRQRARAYEMVAPVRRAALLHEPFSDAVARTLGEARTRKRRDAVRLFAAELGRDADRRAALGAIASFSTWEALRRHQGLSVVRARRALAAAITGLLAGGKS